MDKCLSAPSATHKLNDKLTVNVYTTGYYEDSDDKEALDEPIYGLLHSDYDEEMLFKESTLKEVAKLLKKK